MNTCPEFVQQATEGGFPWIILVIVALVVAGVFVKRNGIVGTKAMLKSAAAKLRDKAAKLHEQAAKIEAKVAASTPAPAAPAAAPAPAAPSNAAKLAELNGMLISGKITLEQHALMTKLLG